MPEQQTPSSDAPSPIVPAVVTVRPLRYADLRGVNAGDEGGAVPAPGSCRGRDFGPLEIGEIDCAGAPAQHRRSHEKHEEVGVEEECRGAHCVRLEVNVHFYDNADAFDGAFHQAAGARRRRRRQQALAWRRSDPGFTSKTPMEP